METLLLVAAIAAVVLGVAGVVLPLLPGTPLLFAGLWLLAWLDGYSRVGVAMVAVLAAMALLGFVVDYLASALGVRRAGASGLAVAGAAVGAVVGLLGGLPGIILGPVIGAVAGEWLAGGKRATRAGFAAGLGFLVAMVAKLAIAFSMLGLFMLAWFF